MGGMLTVKWGVSDRQQPSTVGHETNEATSSLDTTSTLSVTVLASARNFRLYQESSTRTSATRTDNEPAKYNDKR
jgi:hypothetical protein